MKNSSFNLWGGSAEDSNTSFINHLPKKWITMSNMENSYYLLQSVTLKTGEYTVVALAEKPYPAFWELKYFTKKKFS